MKDGRNASYFVLGGDPVASDNDPLIRRKGEMSVEHVPHEFEPNYGTDKHSSYHELATNLGVHPNLIERVLEEEDTKDMAHLENHDDERPGSLTDIIERNRTRFSFDDNNNRVKKPSTNPNRAKDIETLSKDPRFSPDTLFETKPEYLEVTDAFVDPTLRHALPTMTGIAMNDYPGVPLMPSDSLSVHSSKVARHAIKNGWMIPNPFNPLTETTNTMEGINRQYARIESPEDEEELFGDRVSTADVQQAQNTYKNIIRGVPPRKTLPITESGLGHQFKEYPLTGIAHPVLPGMEESFGKVMKRSDWSNIDK